MNGGPSRSGASCTWNSSVSSNASDRTPSRSSVVFTGENRRRVTLSAADATSGVGAIQWRPAGETAPLLLIGMVAFVANYPSAPPQGLFEPASALPVQVYNWTQRADPAFFERASGAIIVLLVFLLAMNLLAIYLRRRFERRW